MNDDVFKYKNAEHVQELRGLKPSWSHHSRLCDLQHQASRWRHSRPSIPDTTRPYRVTHTYQTKPIKQSHVSGLQASKTLTLVSFSANTSFLPFCRNYHRTCVTNTRTAYSLKPKLSQHHHP